MNYGDVKNMYLKKGYKFRTEKMALNIFGIRSKESKSDKFDDLGGVAWINENGVPSLMNFWMTTDPGKPGLLQPTRAEGTIIMVPGQYLNVYEKGLHKGEYDCLKQCSDMHYVRDNNKDSVLDFDLYRNPDNLLKHGFWGNNGTNFHRASAYTIVNMVSKWSEGCQVVQRPETFDKIIALRDLSIKFGFLKFYYTLFEEI